MRLGSLSQTFAFNADTQQWMNLITNTFYSSKEIFLRELISDSSDALYKIRWESIADPDNIQAQPNFFIPDKTNSTITMKDSGVEMNNLDPSPKLTTRLSWRPWVPAARTTTMNSTCGETAAGGSFTVQKDTENCSVS